MLCCLQGHNKIYFASIDTGSEESPEVTIHTWNILLDDGEVVTWEKTERTSVERVQGMFSYIYALRQLLC